MNDNTKDIENFERQFKKLVEGLQRQILRTAIAGLLGYSLQRSRTRLTISNVSNSNRVAARIRRIGRRNRKGLLDFLLDALIKLFDKNRDFYRGEGSTQSVDDAARKKIMLLYGYDVDKKQVLPGSYLDEALNMGGVAQQVGSILNQRIASRSTLPEIRSALRNTLRGTSGLVESHFRRFTRDLFAEHDRAVKLEYKERLGLKYAVYAGTEIATTRGFCDDRLNKVYTEDEILKWNSQEWAGKKPGDVRIVCGGYNCRHHLNWVSEGTAKAIAEQTGGLNTYN